MFPPFPSFASGRRRILFAVAAATALCAPAPQALAQSDYPSRPVTLVVPYPPGGANDLIGRLIGRKLADALGQPVVVDNRPGAGTTIGAAMVAKAPADGYTILLGSLASHAVSPHLLPRVGYSPTADFAPVGLIGLAPTVATVASNSPYTSLQQLVDAARRQPGAIMYGSAGNGSPPHLAGELFAQLAGVDMTHVPYKGGNAHTMDLIGGRLAVIFDTSTGAMPQIRGGKVRALAVAAASREPELPDVPTFAQAGFPGFEVNAWYALYAPAKTPAAVIARLSTELAGVMKQPEVDEKLRGLAVRPQFRGPAELATFTEAEYARYGKVIRSADIKPD